MVEAAIDDFSIRVFVENQCNIGDLNQDGSSNVQDIVSLVNLILDTNGYPDDVICPADLNEDGVLNVQDIILLVNLILN